MLDAYVDAARAPNHAVREARDGPWTVEGSATWILTAWLVGWLVVGLVGLVALVTPIVGRYRHRMRKLDFFHVV